MCLVRWCSLTNESSCTNMSFLQQVNNMSAKWPMLNTKPRSKALPVPRESKMVGATASALMGVMAPLLSKLIFMEDGYGMLRNLQPGITSLRGELGSMKAALEELSRLEQPSSPVREWMGQLRELSYNIEDCVDGFAHGLGQDVDPDGEGLLGKIAGWIEAVRRYHRTAGRIAELKEHAVEVSHRRKRLKLEDIAPSAAGAAMAIDPRLPALFEEADRVIGIDGPREELVGWLVGATTGSASQRRVVSIVGCAGLGKTTLANQVYHRIKGQFDCTAFVSVSRSPNVIKILTDVLLQFLGANNSVLDDDNQRGYLELVGIMREYLRDKRYFVLIDDIWSKQAWSAIQCAFPSNDNASRIMTTTRIQDVAKSCSFPHGGCVYPMKHLGINDSKRLFLKRIFDHEDDCPLELKEVTDDILKKCDGLPLAIVNIASMLATKPTTKQEWGRVRISLCSSHEQDPELDIVKRILFLSYYDLPHYLKICLLDISIFPEDFEICCERLVQRWMAEGFIIEHRGQCLEDTGRSYISELINRNMIQLVDIDSISGRPVACRLHDIMLDLIISLSAKENFVTIMDDENLAPPSKTIRRLSIQGKCERWTLPPGTKKLSHVRSLTVFSDAKKMPLLLDFQVLRVLDLQGCSHVEDGDIMDIGCLIHLRFLSLRKCSRVTEIPRQIGKMQHLQTLDLTFTGIKRLPGTVARLRQLVHLLIPQGVQLPVGIGNMESLEELYWFDVRVISPEVVLELGNMTKLKDLSINWELDDATRDEGRYQNYLMSSLSKLGEHDLRHLEFFMYNGSGSADFLVDSWCPPPRHLQTFKMNSGITTFLSRLPRWISSLSELTCLDIPIKQVGHGDLQVLADLPILLHLGLHLRESPQETLIISPRGFQSLKYLFVGTWGRGGLGLMFEKGAMPKLEKLYCASVARDTYDVGYEFGISQLTSLKHLHVSINCRGARAWEVEAAEGAIRNAAALLPNHPTPEIFRGFQKEMVQNEELMREGHWW